MVSRFVYFDEVKPNPKSYPDYLIAGFSVDAQRLGSLATDFRERVHPRLETLGLPLGTEIHAQHLYHGKGPFKGKDLHERFAIISDTLELLEATEIRLVYARVVIENLFNPDDAVEYAFTHFCERAHNTLHGCDLGMMIGDLDRATRNRLWAMFLNFRMSGTPWAFGQSLPKFIDSVHFVDSRVCEFVQIADVYAFWLSGISRREGYAAEALNDSTKHLHLFPTSYKIWPQKKP
jgi:hypothetical protein